MPPGLPGVDVKFLVNVATRLSERRLHAYHPGARRSAAALILRFDDTTQRTLTSALTTYRSLASPPPTQACRERTPLDLHDFLRYVQDHCVDAAAPSALQLLFLKRADMDASRWSGQVAFPGGRRDPDDADDFATVCRETNEELGLPLQHEGGFVCLGRLPDHNLRSRAVNSSGLVQARFVFLHVGDMTPAVRVSSHGVERVRWMLLRRLSAAHVEHGCVAHPLQSFVHAQDADYRLLLTELFPSTYLTFPSVSLPVVQGDDDDTVNEVHAAASPPSSRTWRVWGLTLRSANELLALDNRQPFDWPLVESNSRVVQYAVLFPFHGYYELLYQFYYVRAWLGAQMRMGICRVGSPRTAHESSRAAEKDRRVLYGSAMEQRYAALPVSANALLFATPQQPVPVHVLAFLCVAAVAVMVLYTIASIVGTLFAAVGMAVGVEATLELERRRRDYYDANIYHRSSASARKGPVSRDDEEEEGDDVREEDASVQLQPSALEVTAGVVASPPPQTSWWPRGGRRTSLTDRDMKAADEAALALEMRSDTANAGGHTSAAMASPHLTETSKTPLRVPETPTELSAMPTRAAVVVAAPAAVKPRQPTEWTDVIGEVEEASAEEQLQAVMDRYRVK